MQYKILGKTGLKVSALGLGGIPVQRITKEEAKALLEYLSQNGVNFIDTARGYTVSEEYLGYALSGGLREKYIIATKSMARSYSDMARDIDISLANLNTDYIDLYQLHNPRTEADLELVFSENGAMRALLEAKSSGKIKHIGATAHSADTLEKLMAHSEIETVMFPFNIVENQGFSAMDTAAEKNIGFIAMKPLAGGNIESGHLAVRYCLSDKRCTVAIPGMATIDEARANISAANDLSPLTDDEKAEIEKIQTELSGDFCRRCGYCAPCSVGIDIPTCFVMQGYLEHYDLAEWGRARYLAMKVTASACIGCGKCEQRCPYNLPIREKLKKTVEVFGV